MKPFIYSFFLVVFLSSPGLASAQDAKTILANMDKVIFSPKDKQGKVTMILTDKSGKEKVREAIMMQKGSNKKLYRYTKPESQAGIATLSLSDDVMWLYMPAFVTPRKISMLAKGQAFNGTDFSYEDMVTIPYSERFTPNLLETQPDAFLLNLVPLSGKSNYTRIIVRVDKKNGYPLTMQYFNGQGKKIKEASYRYEKIGKYWNAAEVVMRDLEKSHSTKILLSDVKFDQGLADDLFLVENLKPSGSKKTTDETR
jgi:outer membrane lipoprotein-sorting protein